MADEKKKKSWFSVATFTGVLAAMVGFALLDHFLLKPGLSHLESPIPTKD